jgi:hypothetical protein
MTDSHSDALVFFGFVVRCIFSAMDTEIQTT